MPNVADRLAVLSDVDLVILWHRERRVLNPIDKTFLVAIDAEIDRRQIRRA